MIVKSFHFTHLGNYRNINEDSLLLHNSIIQKKAMDSFQYSIFQGSNLIFAIADGMGGHEKGEVASYSVLEHLLKNKDSIHTIKDLRTQIFLSKEVLNVAAQKNESSGMGTTLSGIFLSNKNSYIFNIGDSRVYRIERRNLKRITEDHSEVFDLYKSGKITEDQLRTHKRKNILTSALVGDYTKNKPELFEKELEHELGNMFLICSDGLWEGIPTETIQKIFLDNNREEEICNQLINFSLKYSGMDNISFILIKIIDL